MSKPVDEIAVILNTNVPYMSNEQLKELSSLLLEIVKLREDRNTYEPEREAAVCKTE